MGHSPLAGWTTSDREVAAAAELDLAYEGCEPKSAGGCMGDREERVFRLIVQGHVVLQGVAMGAIVGEIPRMAGRSRASFEMWPGLQLVGQCVIHRPDRGDREAGQRLIDINTGLAIDADDFDVTVAFPAAYIRGRHVGIGGSDLELPWICHGRDFAHPNGRRKAWPCPMYPFSDADE